MNRFAFPVLMLGLSFVSLFCGAAEPRSKSSADDAVQLQAAQEERIKVLAQLVEELTAQYRQGAVDFAQVFSAENKLFDAQLDSADEPPKRVALLTTQLDKANDFLKIAEARRDSGMKFLETDVLRAKSHYFGIKIKLLRERSRMKPPTIPPVLTGRRRRRRGPPCRHRLAMAGGRYNRGVRPRDRGNGSDPDAALRMDIFV